MKGKQIAAGNNPRADFINIVPNVIIIIIYKTVHTGPKIVAGGAQLGFCICHILLAFFFILINARNNFDYIIYSHSRSNNCFLI